MRTTTAARFLPLSLLSFVLAVAGCGSKPAATPESSASPSSPNSASNGAPASAPAATAPAPLPPPPPPPPTVIPAGTTITVTLDQTVNSQTANNGDPFAASLAVPLTSGTVVALPVGTKVGGTIVTAQSAGKFKGNALLQLVIDSVRINGTRYPMQTNEFEDVGKGRGKCISNWLSRFQFRLLTLRCPLRRQQPTSARSATFFKILVAARPNQLLRQTATPSRNGTITGNNSLEL
jgi:hypothetical protein